MFCIVWREEMPWFALGEFHDMTKRLICPPAGYCSQVEAEARLTEVLSRQQKPHHVSYVAVEVVSWQQLEREGVKI